jgi:hypothetical protein
MKLIEFREPGTPTVPQCLDVPVPEPKPDSEDGSAQQLTGPLHPTGNSG